MVVLKIINKLYSMKSMYILLCFSVLFMCATCAPLVIKYRIVRCGNAYVQNGISCDVNDTLQKFTCFIKQKHYPSGRVESDLNIDFFNASNDTVFLNPASWLEIRGNGNMIDTLYLKKNVTQENFQWVLPKNKIEFADVYSLNTFRGTFKEFINRLKQEELQLKITYSTSSEQQVSKIVTIIPDLSKYE